MNRLKLEDRQQQLRQRMRAKRKCLCGTCKGCLIHNGLERERVTQMADREDVALRLFASALGDVYAGLRPQKLPPLAPFGHTTVTQYGGFRSYTWQFPEVAA